MKVFITGGAGYIGSVCVERFLQAGHDVLVLDNLSEGHRSAVHPEARFVQACLSDRDATRAVLKEHKSEAVIHFAAHSLVGESMKDPGKYFRNNVANALNLMEAATAAGVGKFVFSSTAATYGTPEHMPITEESPTRPINPYGESKRMVEQMLRWFSEVHGLPFVAFRYFNAAGASDQFGEHHRTETHLIPNVLKVALGQAPQCEIYGTDHPTPDGTCVRDYIHVIDLAEAHLLALTPGRQGIFNLGSSSGCSVREVIETCRRVTGHAIPAVERHRRAGDPPVLVASAERARNELGWKPQFPALEQIIESAWKWHRAHPLGYPD